MQSYEKFWKLVRLCTEKFKRTRMTRIERIYLCRTKTRKNLFDVWSSFRALYAKCYALVFESELSRQVHITYHITSLLQTSKSKNIASLKNIFFTQTDARRYMHGACNHNIYVQRKEGYSRTISSSECGKLICSTEDILSN